MVERVKHSGGNVLPSKKLSACRRRRSAPAGREEPKNSEIAEKREYIKTLVARVQKEAKNFRLAPRRARKPPVVDEDAVPEPDAPVKKRRPNMRALSFSFKLLIRVEQASFESQPAIHTSDSATSVFSIVSMPNVKLNEYEDPIVTAIGNEAEDDFDMLPQNIGGNHSLSPLNE